MTILSSGDEFANSFAMFSERYEGNEMINKIIFFWMEM